MKMLASTVQFSSYGRTTGPHLRQHHETAADAKRAGPARSTHPPGQTPRRNQPHGPIPQDPTACQKTPTHQPKDRKTSATSTFHPMSNHRGTLAHDMALDPPSPQPGTERARKLLRKEVIQPHLPVRLPCYDFVLIASPTFDSSLSEELGHRLRVLPTFMT